MHPKKLIIMDIFLLDYHWFRIDIFLVCLTITWELETDFLQLATSDDYCGHEKRPYEPCTRTSNKSQSFSFHIVQQWNALLSGIFIVSTLPTFQLSLDSHFIFFHKVIDILMIGNFSSSFTLLCYITVHLLQMDQDKIPENKNTG